MPIVCPAYVIFPIAFLRSRRAESSARAESCDQVIQLFIASIASTRQQTLHTLSLACPLLTLTNFGKINYAARAVLINHS